MNFKKLEVYRFAIQFVALTQKILPAIPRGYGDIQDQLKRASLSIPLNIAEASGKTSPRDQKRYFAIARGSTMECAAIVDVLQVLKLGKDADFNQANRLLGSLVCMLSKLAL